MMAAEPDHRRLSTGRLVLASHNQGKLAEFRSFFAPYGIELVAAGDLGLAEPDEPGATFEANAGLKARAATAACGEICLADDSGLEALGLDGAPAVRSARWAGPDRDFDVAMRRVRDELAARHGSFEAADRRARFVAVLCLAWPDGEEAVVEGAVDGLLVDPPRGNGGFGYDPMFQPSGHRLTFGEMSAQAKAGLSHRARALEKLAARHLEPR